MLHTRCDVHVGNVLVLLTQHHQAQPNLSRCKCSTKSRTRTPSILHRCGILERFCAFSPTSPHPPSPFTCSHHSFASDPDLYSIKTERHLPALPPHGTGSCYTVLARSPSTGGVGRGGVSAIGGGPSVLFMCELR